MTNQHSPMNKKILKSLFPALLLIGMLVFLSARNNGEKLYKRTQFLMGTFVEITVLDDNAREKAEKGVDAAFSTLKRLEGLLGRHQEGSDIWRINHSGGAETAVSPETMAVVKRGLEFSKLSGGAFDITVGRLSELWNFEGDRTVPPAPAEIKEALQGVGAASVVIDEAKGTVRALNGVHLDLGAIAKGFAIDRAGEALVREGVENFIVNAGGDMIIRGRKGDKPWRIGLQHPRSDKEILAEIEADDAVTAIVTSGDYERFFEHEGRRYHHILDPSTGYPASGLMSVTIQATDTTTADALCTALFVLGFEKGLKLIEGMKGVEAILVDDAQKVHISEGLKGRTKLR